MRHKLSAFVLFALVTTCGIIAAAAFLSTVQAVISILAILAVVTLTSKIWAPDWYPQVRLGSVSLALLGAVHIPFLAWHDLPYDILHAALIFVGAPPKVVDVVAGHTDSKWPVLVIALLDVTILGILWITARPTVIPRPKIPQPAELRAPDYPQLLNRMAVRLDHQLTDLDVRTDWSDELFAPLDAEVELSDVRGPRRRVQDLVSAVRRDKKTKLFIVLGEPGAGKSVALRKLARLMLRETKRTGVLPIFVNLKM